MVVTKQSDQRDSVERDEQTPTTVSDVFERVTYGDRVQVNDRAKPLTVIEVKDTTRRQRLVLEGPRGGRYILKPTTDDSIGSFRRVTGTGDYGVYHTSSERFESVGVAEAITLRAGDVYRDTPATDDGDESTFIIVTEVDRHATYEPEVSFVKVRTGLFDGPHTYKRTKSIRSLKPDLLDNEFDLVGQFTGDVQYRDAETGRIGRIRPFCFGRHGVDFRYVDDDSPSFDVVDYEEFLSSFTDRFTRVDESDN